MGSSSIRIAAEVAAGLGLYFNKALGNNLLYRFERGQYQEHYKRLQGTGKAMSSVYGGEHLLRLFGTAVSCRLKPAMKLTNRLFRRQSTCQNCSRIPRSTRNPWRFSRTTCNNSSSAFRALDLRVEKNRADLAPRA